MLEVWEEGIETEAFSAVHSVVWFNILVGCMYILELRNLNIVWNEYISILYSHCCIVLFCLI